jgi:autotransporter-associated beta strand protein
LSGSSALSLTNSATPSAGVVLRVGNNDSNTHYAGILSGVAGSLMKVGAGTFMLSGDNTYGGGTTISGGTLQVGSGGSTGALGSGWVTNNSSLIFNRTANTTIANVVSGSGSVLATITGNLTLSAGASVSSTANDIVLSASGNFINNAGNTALSATGNGKRWVIYSADPSLNTFNGLISGSKALWGSTYLSLPPISVSAGNRYVFSVSGGTVTASTTAASKTYGDPAISLSGQISYSLTGPAFGSGNSYGVYASNEFNDSMSTIPSIASSGNTLAAGVGTYAYTFATLGVASGGFSYTSLNNGSFTVAPKTVTYVGSTTNVTYNASPQSANNTYQLTGVISSDLSNVSLSAFTAARGTNAGTYLDTVSNLSGTASGNYQLASSGNTLGSLVIAAKSLTYIGSTTNVVYNASPQSANNTYQLTGVIASDVGNVSLSASTAASGTNAGTYLDTVTNLSGTASGNYQLASSGNTLGSLLIAAKPLNYIGNTTNVTYNASPQSANNSYQLTGVIASDVGNVSLSASTAASGTNAGTYLDTVTNLSGTASGNYQLASGGNTLGSLVIAAKPLTYIGSTTNVTYNASPQSANNTYQLTGVIASDLGNVNLSAAVAGSGTNAGTYFDTVTNLSGTASGNYQLASGGNTLGSLVIAAKPLTYIGSTTNVTYNASPQSANNTYQLTGVIASDVGNVILSASTSASGTNAGTYLDTVTNLSGTASGNYQLASNGNTLGSLVIAAKPLTYIGSTTNVTYNASPQSANNTYQLTGVIASDIGNLSLSASTSASGTNTGTYQDTVTNLSGTASGNYQLASGWNTLGSLVIAAKPLTYIVSTTNVTYNASPQSANNTYQLTGVIASDVGNVSLSAFIAASGTNAGTYYDTVNNLSGTASGNYQLASNGNTPGSLVIAAKPLNYIGSTTNVTYNASPQSANNTYQLTGVIASDIGNVSLSATTPASGTNAGTYLDAVTSLSGTASGNYQLAISGNTLGSLVIAAKPLNYIGNTTTVTYNASPQSANNAYQLTGVIASDVGNVILSASTSASGTNAGTYLDAVTNLSGAASGNYQLASSGNTLGTLVIAAKPLNYIGSTTNVTYNATPQSANNMYQLTGVIASDLSNVSLTASASASGTNAGTYLDTVTSLSGTASGNYQLASSGNTLGSLVIAAKPLTYIGSTTNVTYNAIPQSANNTYQLAGVIASDIGNVSLSASTSASGTNAGTYQDTVTSLSGTASGNYQLASSGNTLGSLVIVAKPLNYIGSTTNVTYNASPQSANNTYQLAGVIASDIGNVSLSASTSVSGTNAGTYQDAVTSLSGTASGNYQLASSGNTLGSLVIAAKPLNYIGSTTNVTYNASPQSANNTYTLKGVIASDIGNVSLSAATPASGTNAGTYLDTLNSLSGAASGNYQLVSGGSTMGSLVIAAKTLTLSSLTANNKVYDATTTATITSYGTLMGDARSSNDNRYYAGDTVELVKSNATANFSDPNVGTGKTVTVTGLALSNSNYTLDNPTTTANITAQALNLLAITGSRRYNGTTLFTYQDFDVTGALKNEVVSLTAGSANTPSPNVGVYGNRPLSGLAISVTNGSADNYTLPTTANLTITKAPLTISATSDSRAYNGTPVSNALPNYSKLFENDTLTGLSQSFASKDAKGTGASTLNVNSGFVLNDGNDGGNYEVTRVPAPGTITPAKLTVAGVTAASKVYDGTRFALLSGGGIEVLGRDSVTLVKTDAVGSFDSKDVGTAKPVTATGYVLSGADAGNYSLIQPAGLLADITPKALRIVANNDTRTYDGMAYNGGNGVTYIGFVAGESQAMLAGILSYGGTSQGAVNVGTYTLQPKGLAARNYSLRLESGQLSILAAPPVVPLIAQWAQAYVPLEPKPTAVPASAPSIVTQGRLTIIAPPQANTVGVATLAVNQTLPAAGQSIQIPMPRELLGLNRATVNVSGLPSWLSFDPLDQVFIVRAVPFGVETIQITVQVDGKIWNLTLDFRSN